MKEKKLGKKNSVKKKYLFAFLVAQFNPPTKNSVKLGKPSQEVVFCDPRFVKWKQNETR